MSTQDPNNKQPKTEISQALKALSCDWCPKCGDQLSDEHQALINKAVYAKVMLNDFVRDINDDDLTCKNCLESPK